MKTNVPTEDVEQQHVVRWFKWQYPGAYIHHSANEGLRKAQYTNKLLSMGLKPGHPDLEILEPRGQYHGLFIEMKRQKNGKVSNQQSECLKALNERGYKAIVCRGADAAIEAIKEYMNNG